jgi:GMP synthase-like glutamine amidotransferase
MLILSTDELDTKHQALLQDLQAFAGKAHPVDVCDVRDEMLNDRLSSAGAVVVVGSYESAIPYDLEGEMRPGLIELVNFLRLAEKPVLAIGFGFELLCVAQGIDLRSVGERGVGAAKIEPTADGMKLFQGSDPLCVLENERWQTDEFPKKLQVLARSQTGVEAVRHKTKLQIGLQQLPADFTYRSDAKMIYENIFSLFDRVL